jgi:hypothetical protein
VTPIDTLVDATSTHGMRVNLAPRSAILTTGVAIPTNRWIASVICSVSSSFAKRRFPSAAVVTCTSEERRRSKAWWTTSLAARCTDCGIASDAPAFSSVTSFSGFIDQECPSDGFFTPRRARMPCSWSISTPTKGLRSSSVRRCGGSSGISLSVCRGRFRRLEAEVRLRPARSQAGR